MGAQQSKSEPVIFYNPNVPLQFSQGLVESLETRTKSVPASENTASTQDVEAHVRERVAEELKQLEQHQQQLNENLFDELKKKNIANDANSVVIGTDIDHVIERIKRAPAKTMPVEVTESFNAVTECYRNNPDRSLNCWEEVEAFKESVAKIQKIFVAAHQ
ncbi:hypothetical protein BDF14DRAFT_1754506 [Spinellus fusiger]|nr:hypothetical protein BDF14DRAFT_1754506 [Spinellus fusiger]